MTKREDLGYSRQRESISKGMVIGNVWLHKRMAIALVQIQRNGIGQDCERGL